MNSRFWTVVILLVATAVLIEIRGNGDRIPKSTPLNQIPELLSDWSGTDVPIDQESLDALGAGDFLSREYSHKTNSQPIDLFVAYFPTQRTGASIHSPRNCLPGSGWTFESSHSLDLNDSIGRSHRVGEYVITDGEHRQFVIYWYQSHGRSIANEYVAKLYLVVDAIKMDRTDGALIRIATPINSAQGQAQAKLRAESFTSQLAPVLSRFIPD
jgi:EpsI family protein